MTVLIFSECFLNALWPATQAIKPLGRWSREGRKEGRKGSCLHLLKYFTRPMMVLAHLFEQTQNRHKILYVYVTSLKLLLFQCIFLTNNTLNSYLMLWNIIQHCCFQNQSLLQRQ